MASKPRKQQAACVLEVCKDTTFLLPALNCTKIVTLFHVSLQRLLLETSLKIDKV